MKRIAIKLVVFLLLGAVVNVAVAWGCAVWSPISLIGDVETRREEQTIHRTSRGFGLTRIEEGDFHAAYEIHIMWPEFPI